MLAETYRRFAENILGDLAERRDQGGTKPSRGMRRIEVVSGEKRRIALRGDHICYWGEDQFRGSDRSFRLAMAVTANERACQQQHGKARGAHLQACVKTAETILFPTTTSDRLRQSFLERRRGPKSKPTKQTPPDQRVRVPAAAARPAPLKEGRGRDLAELDRLIQEGDRYAHKRGQQKQSLSPEVRRVAEVIRVQVDKYRQTHKDWEQRFNGWFAAYCDPCAGDADCAYPQRKTQFEKQLGAGDPSTPRATQSRAMLLHQQGRHEEAESLYVLALERWNRATMEPVERRQKAVAEITQRLNECRRRRPPKQTPIADPRLSRPPNK